MSQTIQQPAHRSRPVRDTLGALANGITRTTPVVVDTAVAALDTARLTFELVRITMSSSVMEERLEAMVQLEQVVAEFKLSANQLRSACQGTILADMAEATISKLKLK